MRKIFLLCLLLFLGVGIYAQDIHRNSVKLEVNGLLFPSIMYNRIIPVQKNISVAIGTGYMIAWLFDKLPYSHYIVAESEFLFWGPKHFLEIGTVYLFSFDDIKSPGIKFGYRYTSKRGLTIRAYSHLYTTDISEPPIVPIIGFGYSF